MMVCCAPCLAVFCSPHRSKSTNFESETDRLQDSSKVHARPLPRSTLLLHRHPVAPCCPPQLQPAALPRHPALLNLLHCTQDCCPHFPFTPTNHPFHASAMCDTATCHTLVPLLPLHVPGLGGPRAGHVCECAHHSVSGVFGKRVLHS